MKALSGVLLVLAVLATTVAAQSNEEKYQQKLKKDFVSTVSWIQSLENATAQAAKEDKLILGYFTRSYSP